MGRARVAVVGGGLAGLAAAAALVDRGCAVELFEARRKLGGRAGSYVDRETDELIDHCQHVAMGCCTNFLDFCRRMGVAELLERHATLFFFGPDGGRSDFAPSRWLPAPLHLAGSLLGLKYLSWRSKVGIARAMLRLIRARRGSSSLEPRVLDWLRGQQQSEEAIERFWKVVLVSALGESLDRAGLSAARKVFLDGFLAHRDASHVLVPRVSLGELYDARIALSLRQRGVLLHLESTVNSVLGTRDRVDAIQLADGAHHEFDTVIVAVPWQHLDKILSSEVREAVDPIGQFATILSAPITSVHLWLDRQIMNLPHAVLVGRLAQWVFARPREATNAATHYYQVVISASHDLAGRERQSVVEEVMADLRAVFPGAAKTQVIRWQVITDRDAVFSMEPKTDSLRPPQRTAIPNLFLAGDWTATGWPATMEGAVRSGYLAAEGVLAQHGHPQQIVAPDLPRGWLVRLLAIE
jgi:squalene-associated FAD-dependent desaturase